MKRRSSHRWWLVAACVALAVTLPGVPAVADDYEGTVAHIRVGEDGWSYELVVAGLHGGSRTVPLDRPALSRPAISPDGTRIAFISPTTDGTDGRFGLYVANLDGTAIRRLTSTNFADTDPAWSPDGSRIAISRDTSGNLDPATCCLILIVEVDGSGAAIVPGTRGGTNPAWSPDGTEIAYEHPDGIHITTLDGSTSRTITGIGGAQPAWSPDGASIAYLAPIATGWELVTRRPNGGSRVVRLTTSLQLEAPTFAPDSETIYYVRYQGEGYDGRTLATLWKHHPDTGASAVYTDFQSPMILASLSFREPGSSCDVDGDGRSDLIGGAPRDDEAVADAGAFTLMPGAAAGFDPGTMWHADSPGVPGSAASGDDFGAALGCGDFDGDGYYDVAVGAPGSGPGAVTVLPGSITGVTTTGSQIWTQDSAGIAGTGRAGDRWGAAIATGDFNADGYHDLAVGGPGSGGAVNVIYGTASGLSGAANQRFTSGDAGLDPATTTRFGAALAAGDLDGDGFDELIIGVPGARVGGHPDAGAIVVLPGSASGLDASVVRTWNQDSRGVAGIAQDDDELGASVASGDLDGDGYDDLVAGAPGAGHGGINVMYGSVRGESIFGDEVWKQNTPGIAGIGHGTDRFGTSVAIGDLDGDGYDDVAIGVPGTGPGAVNVIYGTSAGLEAAGNQIWKQNTPGVAGVANAGDAFGTAVTIADFNGDGFDDLAIGAPGNGPGAVNVLFGTPSAGASSGGDVILKQGRGPVPGTPTGGDGYGTSLR